MIKAKKHMVKPVYTYIALDDVGFLGQVQQHTVIRKVEVGADAPIPSHTANRLGFLGQGD